MHEDRQKAMEAVFRGSDSFILNMNDTFAFASGDSEEMPEYDFNRLVPVIAKYGKDALTAYVAVKRKAEPITCKCNHKNENYYAAKKEIEAIKAEDESFMES
jgi:hypothetical protein